MPPSSPPPAPPPAANRPAGSAVAAAAAAGALGAAGASGASAAAAAAAAPAAAPGAACDPAADAASNPAADAASNPAVPAASLAASASLNALERAADLLPLRTARAGGEELWAGTLPPSPTARLPKLHRNRLSSRATKEGRPGAARRRMRQLCGSCTSAAAARVATRRRGLQRRGLNLTAWQTLWQAAQAAVRKV
eukprot:364900-Chlamydomonas_euryale.AAC.3